MKKKLLALSLALVLILALAACGGGGGDKTPASSAPTGGGGSAPASQAPSGGGSGGSGITLPSGWQKGGAYYDYIDDVWDSSVLPAWFPQQTEGVKPAETNYKAPGKETLNHSSEVGWVQFDGWDYERYSVSFYATEAQVPEFIAQVEAAGMTGGLVDDFPYNTYRYAGNGWVMEVYFNTDSKTPEDGQGEWDGCVTASMAPVPFEHPQTFRGEPLPQCGVPTYDYFKDYSYYDDNYDDVAYDLKADNGKLEGEYWAAWFSYGGCSDDDLKAYVQTLTGKGWTMSYDGTNSDGGYYANLVKDDVYLYATVNHWWLQVGVSPMQENLSY